MKNTDCSRSVFPALRRIPPSWCNRLPWPRSRRRSRAIARICRRTSSTTACCPTPSSKPSSMPARRMRDYLAGSWTVDETFDVVTAARDDAEHAVRFRRGFMLGDGTGAGKGRQSAGIILDNWLQGRRKAVWISQIRQADRGCAARLVGARHGAPAGHAALALPAGQADHAAGRHPVHDLCHAALRRARRARFRACGRSSNGWARRFRRGDHLRREPRHAERRRRQGRTRRLAASQQGRAGLRLQHALPNARVVYVSATGATTVHNLAYAQRLGLWGGEDFPFATRAEFVEAIEAGGVAAMEVLARDLRALGLYTARSLSYDGVEYELVEHRLTPSRSASTTPMPGPSPIIHNNLDAAMRGREHHRRDRHAEPAGQVRRPLGVRIRQAALLRPSADEHEDADADPLDRARSGRQATPPSSRSSRPAKR